MKKTENNFLWQVGQRIRAARIEAGLTQHELANKIGTSQQIISKCENGKQAVRIDKLHDIATVCNVPMVSLIQESDMIAQMTTKFIQLGPAYQQTALDLLTNLLAVKQIGSVRSTLDLD